MLSSELFRGVPELHNAANNSPPLRVGARGTAVQLLQTALRSLGMRFPRSTDPQGNLDGIYGQECVQRVSEFQNKSGLRVDGIAGRNTLGRLDVLLGGKPPLKPPPRPMTVPAHDGPAMLTPRSILMCPHGAPVHVITHRPVLTIVDPMLVAGCPHIDPAFSNSGIGPCFNIFWTNASPRTFIDGLPVLTVQSIGMCMAVTATFNGRVRIVKV